jgi:hypothetical protein
VETPHPTYFSQSLEISQTSLPASFELAVTELPPEPFMRRAIAETARICVGFLLAYEDEDSNGAYTLPNRNANSPDRILSMSELETMVVLQEGPVVATELFAPLEFLFEFDPHTWDPLMMPVGRESIPLPEYGDVDALAPGFNIVLENPLWGQYLRPGRNHNRCSDNALVRDDEEALEACHQAYEAEVLATPTDQLQQCLADAGGDEGAQAVCRETYVTQFDLFAAEPAYLREKADEIVELPVREDLMAGRRFCPAPDFEAPPLRIDLERAVCSADGLSFTVPELPKSQWPSVCYDFEHLSSAQILEAQEAPDWWPCDIP